jgi:hypothetical protein
MRPFPTALALALVTAAACSDSTRVLRAPDGAARTQLASSESDLSVNSLLFPQTAHPYGASLTTWAERESQWVYGHPLTNNPLIDQTGADCDESQTDDHVWFIPRIAGPRVFSGTRTCTIPAHRAIFLEIGAYVNPWPCPDPNFKPAPGQSLYDFLSGDAAAFMDGVNRLDVSLDGRAIPDVLSYRFASPELFTLTGDPTFAALDACVTGAPQPAVVDGFFMMFKPLSPGEHVIRVYGTDVRGADKTYTYFLTVL